MKIRASSLPAYPDCPRRGTARLFPGLVRDLGYDDLRQTLPSAGAAVGQGLHTSAARLMEAKRDGAEPDIKAAVAAGLETYQSETENGAEWDDHTPDWTAGAKQIERMVAAFARGPLLRLEPLFIEQYFEADAGDGVTLTGHVDLITADPGIRDFKNGNVERPFHSQLGGYSLLVRSNADTTGIERIKTIGTEYIYRARLSSPQPDVTPVEYDVEVCERAALATIDQIKRDVRALEETGDCWAIPANPNSMMCHRAYCPAHGTSFCHLWKEEKQR